MNWWTIEKHPNHHHNKMRETNLIPVLSPYSHRRMARGEKATQKCPSSRDFGTSREEPDRADPGSWPGASTPRRNRRKRRRERRGWGGRGCRSPAATGGGTRAPRTPPVCRRGRGRSSNRSFRGSIATPPSLLLLLSPSASFFVLLLCCCCCCCCFKSWFARWRENWGENFGGKLGKGEWFRVWGENLGEFLGSEWNCVVAWVCVCFCVGILSFDFFYPFFPDRGIF